MSNKKLWLGILAMVLVFGFLLMGCGNLTDKNQEDGKEEGSNGGSGGQITYWNLRDNAWVDGTITEGKEQ